MNNPKADEIKAKIENVSPKLNEDFFSKLQADY